MSEIISFLEKVRDLESKINLNLILEQRQLDLLDTLFCSINKIKLTFSSRGISLSPLARSVIVRFPVVLVEVCDFRHKRVIRVGIGE